MKRIFIGIDISKNTLDVCLIKKSIVEKESRIQNTYFSINQFFENIIKEHRKKDILICAEFTGIYSYHLCNVCFNLGMDVNFAVMLVLFLLNIVQGRASESVFHYQKSKIMTLKDYYI